MVKELSHSEVRGILKGMSFECESTADLTPLTEIIGQERAVRALQFGLQIDSKGYNVYLSGMPGTGKTTALVDYLKEIAKDRPAPDDWCYVYNFDDSTKPDALRLPAGMGSEFKDDMEQFVSEIQRVLNVAFESEDYADKRSETLKAIEEERNEVTKKVNNLAGKAGFLLQRSPIGLVLIPIVDGRPINDKEFTNLPPEVQKQIQRRREALQGDLRNAMRQFRDIERKMSQAIKDLNRQVATYALEPISSVLKEKYSDIEELGEYLREVEDDILDNLRAILQGGEEQQKPQLPFAVPSRETDPTERYKVNLIIDNSDLEGAPVVMEQNPTYPRLFGAMEKEARFGTLLTNYTMIRAGSLHKANGGFIAIPVEGLFSDPMIYESLKRTIDNEKIEIEDPTSRFGFMLTGTLNPEPIPFDAKVIIIGDPQIYQLLFARDREFKELFKVKADFDTTMDRNEKYIREYASFICTLVEKEGMMHLDPDGVSAVIEYSSRLAADQKKLSTKFAEVADIIREANFYAQKDGAELVSREHINKALEEKVYRSNLIEKKIEEMISRNILLIDTFGEKVGQVNGLAVLSLGDYSFGKPNRITASVGVGRQGIIDIEREAEMGGPTHTKGVLILSGYLNAKYAEKAPLSLSARLVFEQSYSGVDGE
ncbi:MAG: ATP-binding protein, partial [Candidatus Bathyarchaeota archaeon]